MSKLLPTILAIVIVALLLFAMWWGWRARRRRQSTVTLHPLPATTGLPLIALTVLYVATTKHGSPLDRIGVAGLGFRSKATVTVTTEGVFLSMPGQTEIHLPASAIEGVGRATWTIDRVVERDGLVMIAWRSAGDTPTTLDTYLRTSEDADATLLVTTIATIAPADKPDRPEQNEVKRG